MGARMDDTEIEAVAQAIGEANFFVWETAHELTCQRYRHEARAAIAALDMARGQSGAAEMVRQAQAKAERELDAARAENERLRAALEPFAEAAEFMDKNPLALFEGVTCGSSAIYAARAALNGGSANG